ncbi:MAG: glycosyltransferase [Bacteroidales bacterium]
MVRNLPPTLTLKTALDRKALGVPENGRVILLQGTGINAERGGEELLEAMLPVYGLQQTILWIIGGGDILPRLKQIARKLQLGDRVRFFPKMPYEQLMAHASLADIGLSLDKDRSINYRYSLPNKLFDYIMAGVPVLASDLPEVKKIILDYGVGQVLSEVQPAIIAENIGEMLGDAGRMEQWRANCTTARETLCWEAEQTIVRKIYRSFL